MKTLRVYIITRILLTIPMLFILVTLVFFIVRIMPGDPVEAMLRLWLPPQSGQSSPEADGATIAVKKRATVMDFI